jgi:cell division protein FtsB
MSGGSAIPETRARGRGAAPPESGLKRKALALALFLILAASVLNALFGERGVLGLLEAQRNYQALLADVESLENNNQRLIAEIDRLRNDPMAIERIAREVLGMVRAGEIVVEIVPDENEGEVRPDSD